MKFLRLLREGFVFHRDEPVFEAIERLGGAAPVRELSVRDGFIVGLGYASRALLVRLRDRLR